MRLGRKVGEVLAILEVVFCGNSVYLCGLAAGLRQHKKLRIRMVDNPLDQALPELSMLQPHVVVAENPDPAGVKNLQASRPGLLLISIDAATDSFQSVAAGQPVLPVEELAQVLFQHRDTNNPME